MIVHNLPGLHMQRLYQMVTYFLPLYPNYKIRETAVLAVSCVEVGKGWGGGDTWGYGVTANVSRSRVAVEWPGHTWGSGTVVAEDREVGPGWNLSLSAPSFGAVGKSLKLSIGAPWNQCLCDRKTLVGSGCHLLSMCGSEHLLRTSSTEELGRDGLGSLLERLQHLETQPVYYRVEQGGRVASYR